jgi:pullulanase
MQLQSGRGRPSRTAGGACEQAGTTAAAARRSRSPVLRLAVAVLLASPLLLVQPATALAAAQPASVTLVGDFQSELGCTGDFQPSCAVTQLAYDANDDVWQGTFTLPAGQWQYKVALNGSFDENYGANATPDGPSITLVLATDTSVKFYYDNSMARMSLMAMLATT